MIFFFSILDFVCFKGSDKKQKLQTKDFWIFFITLLSNDLFLECELSMLSPRSDFTFNLLLRFQRPIYPPFKLPKFQL